MVHEEDTLRGWSWLGLAGVSLEAIGHDATHHSHEPQESDVYDYVGIRVSQHHPDPPANLK